MYQAIVFLPLIGAIFAGFFGRLAGARASEVMTTTLILITALLSWFAFYQVGIDGQEARIELFASSIPASCKTSWALRIDTLTAVMLVVVTTVSGLVHLYSIGYMEEDRLQAALLRLSLAVHLRHAGAGDGRQFPPALFRLGGRRPRLLSPDRLLVPQAFRQRRRHQGLHRQPRRRFRLRARHLRHLHRVRQPRLRHRFCLGPGADRQDHGVPGLSRWIR